jgi:hypothetical protein
MRSRRRCHGGRWPCLPELALLSQCGTGMPGGEWSPWPPGCQGPAGGLCLAESRAPDQDLPGGSVTPGPRAMQCQSKWVGRSEAIGSRWPGPVFHWQVGHCASSLPVRSRPVTRTSRRSRHVLESLLATEATRRRGPSPPVSGRLGLGDPRRLQSASLRRLVSI